MPKKTTISLKNLPNHFVSTENLNLDEIGELVAIIFELLGRDRPQDISTLFQIISSIIFNYFCEANPNKLAFIHVSTDSQAIMLYGFVSSIVNRLKKPLFMVRSFDGSFAKFKSKTIVFSTQDFPCPKNWTRFQAVEDEFTFEDWRRRLLTRENRWLDRFTASWRNLIADSTESYINLLKSLIRHKFLIFRFGVTPDQLFDEIDKADLLYDGNIYIDCYRDSSKINNSILSEYFNSIFTLHGEISHFNWFVILKKL